MAWLRICFSSSHFPMSEDLTDTNSCTYLPSPSLFPSFPTSRFGLLHGNDAAEKLVGEVCCSLNRGIVNHDSSCPFPIKFESYLGSWLSGKENYIGKPICKPIFKSCLKIQFLYIRSKDSITLDLPNSTLLPQLESPSSPRL